MRRGTLTSCSVGLERLGEGTALLREFFGDSVELEADFFITEFLAKLKKCKSHAVNRDQTDNCTRVISKVKLINKNLTKSFKQLNTCIKK